MIFGLDSALRFGPCFLCGKKTSNARVIGIALSAYGEAYAFCRACSRKTSLEQLWSRLFHQFGFSFPPKWKEHE